MLHSHYYHHHHLLLLTQHHYSPLYHSSPSILHFIHKPTTTLHTVSAIPSATLPLLTHLAQVTNETEEGPIKFLPFFTSIIDTIDDPAILQVASTVILTAIITAFFRSRWRRVKRAQELKIRLSGAKKSFDSSRGMGSSSIKAKSKKRRRSPDQTLLGAAIAGVIAVLLFKFTISVDAGFNRQGLADNFSVRQATLTIRTIIIDLCFFATFVYGICSIGLLLYSGELALNIFLGRPSIKGTQSKITEQSGLSKSSETLTSNNELASTKEDQSSKNSQ
ncbi:hypothetical protein TanjilG_15198 [Lupinus angustifolius]|uniref:Transmembrane protein n=1 Tax=Lupinus angustifolius TaxID=3871 RepID=A0A1J7I2F2_LUPAN|nr:PREDICTED: uncharacterized protein LOC109352475 [Lupinus angustifolius]OIW08237.1 hypothetical protein TanjilG_15198 [Lupinus angustifolius]